MMQPSSEQATNFPTEILSKALFIVNRHAKTAIDSKYLYQLKHATIKKMLAEGKAKKIGLHFSRNPKFSQQQLDVLISCGNYYFHIPPTREDIHNLTHLGKLDDYFRNPKTILPLKEAKKILQLYTGIRKNENQKRQRPRYQQPFFKRLGE